MNKGIIALLLTCLAGFSTLLGSVIVIIQKKINKESMIYIIGFTLGVIIFLTAFELIPESYEHFKSSIEIFWVLPIMISSILIGLFATNIFDMFLHHDHDKEHLFHVGILTTISVSLHKLPEAITIFLVSYADVKIGILMTMAVALHHIPEGIMISSPIYHDTKSKWKAFKYALISSLINPIGGLLAYFFAEYFVNSLVLGTLFGLSIGTFIFLIFKELIPTALKYNKNKKVLIAFLIGFFFSIICHLFLE